MAEFEEEIPISMINQQLMNPYKGAVLTALDKLIEANLTVMEGALAVALQGPLKEWSNGVADGEEHAFTFDTISKLEDDNVQMLVALMEQIQGVYECLCVVNDIEADNGQLKN